MSRGYVCLGVCVWEYPRVCVSRGCVCPGDVCVQGCVQGGVSGVCVQGIVCPPQAQKHTSPDPEADTPPPVDRKNDTRL